MTDEWVKVRLAEVFAAHNGKLGEHAVEPRVLSLSKYDGFVPADEYFDKRIASKNLGGYKTVDVDDWAYSTIHIDEGSIARNRLGYSGVISPMYTTMRWISPDHSPEFFELVLKSPAMLAKYGDAAQGTVNRRRSLPFKTFSNLSVLAPPLLVQRRIVDLVAHCDKQLEALRAERARGEEVACGLIERLLDSEDLLSMRPLGEVGEFLRGRRFTKADYVDSGLGCIHYGQVHTDFGPVATEVLTFVPEQMRSRLRLAKHGDVVIAATSEDFAGLGKATVWLGSAEVAVHDDCYVYRHVLDPTYATYAIASPWFQRQKRQFAGGTKVTRISAKDLAAIEVPIPPMERQRAIGAALAAFTEKNAAISNEVHALKSVRSTLLHGLLARDITIPESYDQFLDTVA